MSKRRSLTLVVAENPNPRYPSLEAALRANLPLLARLVAPSMRPAATAQQTQPITPEASGGEMEANSA